MATIPSFEVPDEVLDRFPGPPEEFLKELRLAAAAFWYDRGEVSQGMGASIAGLNRTDFLFGLSRLKVDIFQETIDELRESLARE